ncbi:hypothetical protein BVG16_04440 [Paenibacillus selenitireducens]|uniref:Uncharacterized protein n=1 Tax=Paenibacillus selenitireducens TaxID=1324314 RepID=A0A1T2XJF1_9BACL|nr:hypothetical protein [Paenibacillus selenitireducens]OPA80007.1 hypothetical protein BVG16_04440 [Paenibacillus selenitireducens]
MAVRSGFVECDYVIEEVRKVFQCTVLQCEGRPCLAYGSKEELEQISDFVKTKFDKDLLDIFFTSIESIPPES